MKVFTVYGAKVCQQCRATERWLTERGQIIIKVDVDENDIREKLRAQFSYQSIPVVVVHDADTMVDHWCGFNPNKLKEHANV